MLDKLDNSAASTVLERAWEEKAEMMKKLEVAGTPGPAHKALEAFVGHWNAQATCFGEPGGAAQRTPATAKARWTLNGRFVEGEFQGEMLGKLFTGRSLLGYDTAKQKFISVWVSDLQTSMFISEGKGDTDYRVITLEGRGDCPATGRKGVPMKQVFRVLSPDHFICQMFDASKGRTMEITFTRA